MTTKITVENHENSGRTVYVDAQDQQYDSVTQKPTSNWELSRLAELSAGKKQEFYATDSRRILVSEVKADAQTGAGG